MKKVYKTPLEKLLYQREYSRKNREGCRLRAEVYYKKNRAAINSKRREQRALNPERFRKMAKDYKEANRERVLECKRKSNRRCREKGAAGHKAWVARNPERVKAIKKAWRQRNPHYAIAIVNKRRAQKLALPIKDCTEKIKVLSRQPFCHWCCTPLTKETRNIDHVTPLSRGGKHCPDNLVAACVSCNTSKGKKLVHEWTWKEAA